MGGISGKDLAYRALASAIGGPVDLATMAMRPFGYKVENPVLGSEWIGQKMQDTGLTSEVRDPLKEFAASVMVPSPGGLATGFGKGAALLPAIAGMTKTGRVADALSQVSPLDRMMKASKGGLIDVKNVFAKGHVDIPEASFMRGSKPRDEIVKVQSIAPTQSEVKAEGLLEKLMEQAEGASTRDANTGVLPEVIKYGDEYLLLDGHHRVAAQIAQGATTTPVHVIGEISK